MPSPPLQHLIDLPIVDISPFMAGDGATGSEKHSRRDACAARMLEALEKFGAFALVGHPVSPTILEETYAAALQFFDLPLEVKKEIPIKPGGFTRGYVGVGGESGSSALEVKEAFSYGYSWDANEAPRNPLQGPNVFPSSMSESTKQALHNYYNLSVKVAESVTSCLAWGLKSKDLVESCKEGETISLMRMFKYYPYDRHGGAAKREDYIPDVDRIGSSAHTDWGYLTLISSKVPGLQIALKKDKPQSQADDISWATVNPVEGAIIVNAGDYLSLITKGRVRSPLHRVVTATEERVSFVFFYYPNYDAKLSVANEVDESLANDGKGVGLFQELSLFKDQRESPHQQSESLVNRIGSVSFGQYISEKWASVFRKSNTDDGTIKSY
ncbi:hypothetical protein HDU67_008745 [Dinochytrium kinnereticum]|nr:hypothetical protein HDU67_008745 [Dinochytrium kinnereticum]